jgi:carboxypeptidase C (cathepsin A)
MAISSSMRQAWKASVLSSSFTHMHRFTFCLIIAWVLSAPCFAQPAPTHIQQSVEVGGRSLRYTLTAGTLPVLDEHGATTADVFYIAYVLDGVSAGRQPMESRPHRPVTFALNGGPGSASVFLHLGGLGPRRVSFANQPDMPSDPVGSLANPDTWLDFTDLVFIDPVGTGFSRSRLDPTESGKRFYGTRQDIEYLSRIVCDWLTANGRMTSPVYLAGESYGGYRVPAMSYYLQTQLGLGVQGEVLISPALDNAQRFDPTKDVGSLSPMPFVVALPSFAAAHLEQLGLLDEAHMAPALAYARGDYIVDLMRGETDPQARERLVGRVTDLTGLDPAFVRRTGGRIEVDAFTRERLRRQAKLSSQYDINVTADDPFPFSGIPRAGDPVLDRMVARVTAAVTDLVTREVGWKATVPYVSISYPVNKQWNGGRAEHWQSIEDLRRSLAADTRLKVLIAHGWTDLACPVLASMLIVDQMPDWAEPSRVQIKTYAGGHMFYTRPGSGAALKRDVMRMYFQQ